MIIHATITTVYVRILKVTMDHLYASIVPGTTRANVTTVGMNLDETLVTAISHSCYHRVCAGAHLA